MPAGTTSRKPRSFHLSIPVRSVLFCCATLLSLPLRAAPQPDRITGRGFYEDNTGTLTWEQARLKPYTPYRGGLTKGFGASAIWLRLRLDPGPEPAPGAQLMLRMRPNFIDTIVLYDPLLAVSPLVTGAIHARPPGSASSLNYSLTIPAGAAPRHIWLRLTSNTTRTFWVEAVAPSAAELRDSREEAIISFALGLTGAIVIWSLVSFLRHREPLMLRFLSAEAFALAYAFMNVGYASLLLDNGPAPGVLHLVRHFLAIAICGSMVWFACALLIENGVPRTGPALLMRVSLLGVFLALVLLACGQFRFSLQLNATVSVVAPLIGAIMLMVARPPSTAAPSLIPRSIVWLYLALLSVRTNSILGFTPPEFFAVYGSLSPGLGGGALMVWVIARRDRLLAQAHSATRLRNQLAEQRLDQERHERERQTEFLAMITHELKNPLAVIRMFLSLSEPGPTLRERADQAIVDMAALIDRCSLIDRLDEETHALTSASPNSLPGSTLATPAELAPCCIGSELSELRSETPDPSRLHLRLDSALPLCLADRALLRILFSNLLDNALKYAHPGSGVDVTAAPEELGATPGIAVRVRNLPGPAGWPDPKLLFRRYYRAPGARRHIGTGLGLYLAARLAHRLGGNLNYTPDATHVVFKLWLPAQPSL